MSLLPLHVGVYSRGSVGLGQATGGVKPCQRETCNQGDLRHALTSESFDQDHNEAVSQSQRPGDYDRQQDHKKWLMIWWLGRLVVASKHVGLLIETGAGAFSADNNRWGRCASVHSTKVVDMGVNSLSLETYLAILFSRLNIF